jgi:hypothetical protein
MNTYKFQPDQPSIIALKFKSGKPFQMGEVHGYSYTMGNGLTVRFPVGAHTDIQALHLDAGMPFRVTKRTVPGQKEFAWDIERLGDPDAIPNRPVSPEKVSTSTQCTDYQDDTTEAALPPAILKTEHGRDVLMHLIGAIEICHAAEGYSRKHLGKTIRFSPSDIRAIAISCSIQQSHELIEDNRLLQFREPMVHRGWLAHTTAHAVAVGERGNR